MSQSYYGSTDPMTTPGTSGLLTYSNFNAINSPFMKSTGTVTYQAATGVSVVASSCVNAQTVTASSAVNAVNVVATSCNTLPIIGSTGSAVFNIITSSSAVLGQLGSTGSATFNTLGSSSGVIGQISSTHSLTLAGNFVHSESPTISTVVGTCAMPASDNVPNSGFTILSSSSGDINRYYMQAPTCGARATLRFHTGATTANIAYVFFGATNSTAIWIGSATCGNIAIKSCGFAPEIELYGVNDSIWAITRLSTYCENGGTISLVSSSCS